MINLNQNYKIPSKVKTYVFIRLCIILGIISCVVLFQGLSAWLNTFISLWLIVGIWIYLAMYLIYKNISYQIDDYKIAINSGVFTKRSKAISFDMIQNVDVLSGVVMRWFNLSRVSIWTASPGQINIPSSNQRNAGTSHTPDGSLLLLSEDAEWLKNFITDHHSK